MTCQEVIDYMHRQLDGDLSEHEYEILMKHTRHCPDCAAMFERLKKLSEELGNLPHVMPKYSLVDAILPQLEQIVPIRQPEAAAMELEPVAAQPPQTARRAKARNQLRFRAITGVIAASVAAGLFLVSYNAGLFPSSSSFGDSDKAESVAAADVAANQLAPSQERMDAKLFANETGEAEVGTESIGQQDNAGATDGSSNDVFKVTTEKELGISAEDSGTAPSNSGNSSGGSDEPVAGGKDAGPVKTEEVPSVSEPSQGSGDGSEPDQGITGLVPAPIEAVSPDGSLIAKGIGYQIHVYKTGEEGGAAIYDSERRNGKIATLAWSEDGKQLTYEIQLESGGMERFVIDLESKTESKAAH